MGFGDVVNQFHNQYSFADTGASEETNLSSLGVGGEQIDNLDTSDENLLFDAHLLEGWSFGVNGLTLVGFNGAPLVDWVSDDIDDTAEGFGADGDHDGVSGISDHVSSDETLSTIHSNGSDGVFSQVLSDLQDELGGSFFNNKGIENLGKSILHVSSDE